MLIYNCAQHDVDIVRDLTVFQWKGVGVVPQRRGRIAMTEPVLGPEELAPADQEGGHRMPQPVETDPDQVGLRAQLGEPVTHGVGGEAPLVVDIPREHLHAKGSTLCSSTPGSFAGPPQFDSGPTEGKPADPFGLGRTDLFPGDPPLDGEHPAVQIAELERRHFTPASPRVCRQPRQQSDLFGLVE